MHHYDLPYYLWIIKTETKMKNLQRKEIAKRYYTSISNNEVVSARMSPEYKGDVTLKVYNPIFKTEGNIRIAFNLDQNELALCSEIGVHGMAKISDFK